MGATWLNDLLFLYSCLGYNFGDTMVGYQALTQYHANQASLTPQRHTSQSQFTLTPNFFQCHTVIDRYQ